MFFDGWPGLLRVVVVGTLAYAGLILILRVSGKRTLSKMNAFDLVVTVALGSTLATVLLSKDVALTKGIVAFLVLVGLQYAIAWASVRSKLVRNLVKAEPVLLFHDGRMLDSALARERVVPEEILAALRNGGHADPAEVAAVVLETDGTFSVIGKAPPAGGGAMSTVAGRVQGSAA
mgnify:CR=1 FL=1